MADLLKGKVCLVTGAGRGIGRAIAQQFAKEGAIVYANEVRQGAVDEWLTDDLFSNSIIPLYFNISDESEAKGAFKQIKDKRGRLDVLVNNAGIEYNELIGMISPKHMTKMFEVNVYGTIEMLQLASRVMARQPEGGSIINISSMVGVKGNKGQLVYSATKGAVIAITKSAAKELGSKNIRVNSIAPGLTKTEMMDAADQEKLKDRINNISMGRIAQPLDIANACVFLASDLSSYVSGQVIGVEGCTIM
ncbi:SDR family NAD(P)-dependent oxidoreductase [Desulforamulus aeronauticus]|uniref:3-oxoacyl-[acyl-carrier protein] reductase n=1 Tax=Desulforamulus aeronauticus DSM 10349 TaxID=1121421 RepID=A0A1M6V474_9FIRM|nr:glucose 1-dehydrogenase [Desulforamulus aeronauticus]SHK76250.1 3-oxoacyl-[acyl-carrier protein] reductase [Desulforamulus aeronauticus DSM 10349]